MKQEEDYTKTLHLKSRGSRSSHSFCQGKFLVAGRKVLINWLLIHLVFFLLVSNEEISPNCRQL